jgi:ribonuclease BN (tRNA processing enzyme)
MTTSDFRVTILGCSGSYAGPGEACSGYLIQSATTSVWVDCGSGTFANLQTHIGLHEVDAMVISHSHPDHCADLPLVYNAGRYYLGLERIVVHATQAVRDFCDPMVHLGVTSDLFDWHIHTDGSEAQVGDMHFRFSRTDHPVETHAMRVTCGDRSMIYTADTGPGWSLSALGSGADLLIGEGTMLNEQESMGIAHLSGRQLGCDAAAAGISRLVLTHVPPVDDPAVHAAEVEAAFGSSVEVASPGLTFQI